MLRLVTGRIGCGKTARIYEEIRKITEQGGEVTLVVPEQYSFHTEKKMLEMLGARGADRVELYTESYAANYKQNREKAIEKFVIAARKAEERLKYMTFYSTTPRCLRGYLLSYFGEAAPQKCENCSNCLLAAQAAEQVEEHPFCQADFRQAESPGRQQRHPDGIGKSQCREKCVQIHAAKLFL